MRAGKLKHPIIIEQASSVRDDRGEETEVWTTFKQVRAGIYPKTGSEKFELHQENNEITHEVVIRYQSGFTPKMRVNFSGRLFDIESIINFNEANKTLKLMCIERL